MSQLETHSPSKAKVGSLYKLTIPKWHFDAPKFTVFDNKGLPTNREWVYEHPTVCMVVEQHEEFVVVLSGENIIRVGYSDFETSIQGYDVFLVPANAIADKHTK